MSTVEQVLRFKQALRLARTGENLDEPEITHTTNRGHKLEHGARFVSSRSLRVPIPGQIDSNLDDEDEELSAAEEDLKIDVAKILQPISDPAEVASHQAIKNNFLNPFLQQLAGELLDEIVEEEDTLAQVVKMLQIMLGDDDEEIIPQVMAKLEEPQPYPTPQPGERLPPVNDDVNWFFKQPEIVVDADHGLRPEEAQELREKLQVVQQQMEEYVRCITQTRGNLTRTHRLRRAVLNWCREMNNEDWVKADLDSQNNFDNAGLGERPPKDMYHYENDPDAAAPAPAPNGS